MKTILTTAFLANHIFEIIILKNIFLCINVPTINTGLAAVKIVPVITAAIAPSAEIRLADFLAMPIDNKKPINARRVKPTGKGCNGGSTYCNTIHGNTTRHTIIDTNSVKRIAITTSESICNT